MSHAVFRRTFLPPNTPTLLSRKIFEIYAITHSSKELNFDDFVELNYLIKTPGPIMGAGGRQNKKALLCFYFFKQHGILDAKQA